MSSDSANSSPSKKTAPSNSMNASVLKSVLLHGIILASLLISFNFSTKPLVFAAQTPVNEQAKPDIVKATFIDSNVIEQKKREKAQSEAAAAKRQRQEQQKRQEQERLRKKRVEDARKQKEEKQRQEQIEEQNRLNALERERQKEQQIAQQRAQDEAMQQALAAEMAEQLKQEQAAMQASQQRRIMSEMEKYISLVTQTITRNLNSDGGFKDKTCTINVRVASNGLVLSVKVIEGDPALCREAQSAVLRSETLPVSPDPLVYERMKNLNFIVKDLK